MKLLTAAFLLFASSAYAGETARVVSVTPVYGDNFVTVDGTRCYDVSVPVYRTESNSNGGNVLGGMIIGGLIGKGITGDDSGAAIGAVLGGVSAAERTRSVHDGYRTETRCERTESLVNKPVLSYYIVEYRWNRNTYRTETKNFYRVGDTVEISPSLN